MIASTRATYDLVVASDRVPAESEHAVWHAGLASHTESSLASAVAQRDGVWIGADPSDSGGDPGDVRVHRVELSRQEAADYRDGQCGTTLAPIYQGRVQPPSFRRRWREAYRAVNHRYAATIAAKAAQGATVWVHDYHLQLVPGHLRLMRPDLSIGFFLHSPFPPAELFMQLPARLEIISGLLGADLIGFEQSRSARNFLDVAGGLANLPTGDEHVLVGQRQVRVGVFPVPADVPGIQRLAADPAVKARASEIRQALHTHQTVFLSVAGWDHADGVEQRLDAYAQLLATGRLDPARNMLIHLALSEPETAQQQQLRQRVERRVAQINGMYSRVGRCVVQYLHGECDRRELVAFYLAADVLVATPLNDGISLTAQEFVASRLDDTGHVVLSDFAGAASDLGHAVVVNPHDVEAVANAMHGAALQSGAPSPGMRHMRRSLGDESVEAWTAKFLRVLTEVRASQSPQPSARTIHHPARQLLVPSGRAASTGPLSERRSVSTAPGKADGQ